MCRAKCYMNHDCVSYNLGPSPTPGMMVCQLNDADRYQYPDDYQERPGYSYRGTENKCAENPCTTANQTCQTGFNTEGYRCLCPKGSTGVNCEIDIDECSNNGHNCSLYAECTNEPGSFQCRCLPGYLGDGVSCIEIDECSSPSLNNCSDFANCTNTPGSFQCTCKPGFVGDGINCT
ncbi:protein kinase C-binding protein NELL2-like, partial [Actinia tenebrosa]|uniref:Protein kinase C-binding protein NELL2-like n=1 Tax=Actinia tenebrosa TaxID=6105 RepID=A0A6P8IVM2_ACTTE